MKRKTMEVKVVQELGSELCETDQDCYLHRLPTEVIYIIRQGYQEGMYHRGCVFYKGTTEQSQDYGKAMMIFTKLVKQGHVKAQDLLTQMYIEGQGTKEDFRKAFDKFDKLAQQGDAFGQYNVGYMYMLGRGTTEHNEKGMEMFSRSAEQENSFAQYGLGEMYANGYGVEKDYKKAIEWYFKSAEQGDSSVIQVFK